MLSPEWLLGVLPLNQVRPAEMAATVWHILPRDSSSPAAQSWEEVRRGRRSVCAVSAADCAGPLGSGGAPREF